MKTFLTDLRFMFYYIFLFIINPFSAVEKLIKNNRKIIISLYCFLFFTLLYYIIYIPASFLRITGLPTIWDKIINKDYFYQYVLISYPVIYFFDLIMIAIICIFGMFVKKDIKDNRDFDNIFSTMMFAIYVPVSIDLIWEAVMVIYAFITQCPTFPIFFLLILWCVIGIFFTWTVVIIAIAFKKLFVNAITYYCIIAGTVSCIFYGILLALWIA